MNEQNLRRRLQQHTLLAIQDIETCRAIIEPQTQPGLSTYILDQTTAIHLLGCVDETLDCLRKLLVRL